MVWKTRLGLECLTQPLRLALSRCRLADENAQLNRRWKEKHAPRMPKQHGASQDSSGVYASDTVAAASPKLVKQARSHIRLLQTCAS